MKHINDFFQALVNLDTAIWNLIYLLVKGAFWVFVLYIAVSIAWL